MLKNLSRFARTLPKTLPQKRFSTYLYNRMAWEQDYPDFTQVPQSQHSIEDLCSEAKKVKYLHEAQFPYNFKGTKTFKSLKRALDTAVLDPQKIDIPKTHAKLQTYFKKYLTALASGDPKDLPPCESNLLAAFIRGQNQLQKSGFSLELRQSPHEFKERGLKEHFEIFEIMHVMGLSVERAKNLPLEEYHLEKGAEGRGLLEYFVKEKTEATDPESKKAEEFTEKLMREQGHPSLRGFRAIIPDLQLILRIYIQYTSNYKIIPLQSGNDVLGLDDYSFRHVAIFENQLRMPPPGAFAYKESEEMVGEYRLQEWKMVDFDGTLQGNPLLVDKAAHAKLVYLSQ